MADKEKHNDSNNESRIERVQKRLYSRDAPHRALPKRRRLFGRSPTALKDKWEGLPPRRDISAPPKEKRSLLPTIVVGSMVFFILALGVSAFLFTRSGKDVSPGNVNIVVQGPATIEGGEVLTLQISVTNRNPVAIEQADLIVAFPDGTRSASDLSLELPRTRELLGTLAPGDRSQKTVRAVLFGGEHDQKTISITVEYRVEGSNAIFFTDHAYDITLSAAPLTVGVESLTEAISGQEAVFTVTVTSNSSSVIKDVLLTAEYPFGFAFVSANPTPSFTESVWELGDLEPEGKRTVSIRGTITGEDGEERVLRFSSGIQNARDEKKIATTFISVPHSVRIEKPFIGVDLALDGSDAETYVAERGKKIRADITWMNNLPVQITDAVMEVALSGDIIDKRSVSADRGFYRSIDNTIIWSRETNSDFASISPGESGRVTFSFSPLALSSGNFVNPEITLSIDVTGKRISDRNAPEEILATLGRTIKVASDLLFTSRAVHYSGPFTNTGPMPPSAEQETTYTILWTLTNTSNAVSGARVGATLPSYVRWTNMVSPAGTDISFNPVGGQVVWNAGTVSPGGGTPGSQKEVAFQIALLPSVSHIQSSPIIVNEQTATAVDEFTGTNILVTKPVLNTRLSTDPGYRPGEDRVEP